MQDWITDAMNFVLERLDKLTVAINRLAEAIEQQTKEKD